MHAFSEEMVQLFSLIFQVVCDLEEEKYYFICITRAQQSLPRIEKSCSEDHSRGVWLCPLQGTGTVGLHWWLWTETPQNELSADQ